MPGDPQRPSRLSWAVASSTLGQRANYRSDPVLEVDDPFASLLRMLLPQVIIPETYPPGPHHFRTKPSKPFVIVLEVEYVL